MRISHRELEACAANPRRWVADRQGRAQFGWSYDRVARASIYKFHRTSSQAEALEYFNQLLPRVRLKDGERAEASRTDLERYIRWSEVQRPLVADTCVRIELPLSAGVALGGEVSRIDVAIDENGYRAVIIGAIPMDWTRELRMPLIQRAIARRCRRDEFDVRVGFQRLDGSGLHVVRFTERQIAAALERAETLAAQVAMLLAGSR